MRVAAMEVWFRALTLAILGFTITSARAIKTNAVEEKNFIGWEGLTGARPSLPAESGLRRSDGSHELSCARSKLLGRHHAIADPHSNRRYHNFLTEQECDHLISLAKPHMQKSMVVDSQTGKSVASDVRTSSGYFLGRGADDVVKRVEQRIAEFTTLPVDHGESLHVLNYHVTERYQAHFDYFHDTVNTVNGGQRLATMLMYLSDVDEGGETVFPSSKAHQNSTANLSSCGKQGLAVKPKKGDALLFYSLKPDGSQDPSSLHSGCPVIKGDKWSATKWIRQRPYQN